MFATLGRLEVYAGRDTIKRAPHAPRVELEGPNDGALGWRAWTLKLGPWRIVVSFRRERRRRQHRPDR
jgi:hypothetical protein